MKQGFVFQESTENGNSLLVGENRTLIVGERKEGVKNIVDHISVLGMFVKDDTRNLDVADFAIEDSGFTQDVNTFNFSNIFQNFFEDMIGGKTKRVIDVENKRAGLC